MTTSVTIARERKQLIRIITTVVVWLKLICSVCNLVESTMHDSIPPLEIVEPSTYRCGEHRQSANVDKKFGHLKKQSNFTYGTYTLIEIDIASSKNAIGSTKISITNRRKDKVFGKRSQLTTSVTIARERKQLIRIITTVVVWLKLICSVCITLIPIQFLRQVQVFGKRSQLTTSVTIARERKQLIRIITTVVVWLKLICSVCIDVVLLCEHSFSKGHYKKSTHNVFT